MGNLCNYIQIFKQKKKGKLAVFPARRLRLVARHSSLGPCRRRIGDSLRRANAESESLVSGACVVSVFLVFSGDFMTTIYWMLFRIMLFD